MREMEGQVPLTARHADRARAGGRSQFDEGTGERIAPADGRERRRLVEHFGLDPQVAVRSGQGGKRRGTRCAGGSSSGVLAVHRVLVVGLRLQTGQLDRVLRDRRHVDRGRLPAGAADAAEANLAVGRRVGGPPDRRVGIPDRDRRDRTDHRRSGVDVQQPRTGAVDVVGVHDGDVDRTECRRRPDGQLDRQLSASLIDGAEHGQFGVGELDRRARTKVRTRDRQVDLAPTLDARGRDGLDRRAGPAGNLGRVDRALAAIVGQGLDCQVASRAIGQAGQRRRRRVPDRQTLVVDSG